VELVETGWNTLAGANETTIQKAISRALNTTPDTNQTPLYGTGSAGQAVVEVLCKYC
jgi:UDP-N-acetylglucosamine 2-epimerase